MMMPIQLPRAPRLHFRRPAHLTRLASLTAGVVILAIFLLKYKDFPIWLTGIWLVINLASWLLEFLITFDKTSLVQLAGAPAFYRRHQGRGYFFIAVAVVNLIVLFELSSLQDERIDSITMALVIYNLLTCAWLEYETFRWFNRGHGLELWVSLSIISGLCTGWTIWRLHQDDPGLGIGIGVLTTLMNIVVYVMQRLGSEDRIRANVIHSIILQILGIDQTREQWKTIVEQVHERLRYDHVSILEPDIDRSELVVVAETGGYTSHKGKSLSIQDGITGRAFTSSETVAWNDISKCPYYKTLMDPKLENTRAEIAIPIKHKNIIYGILDVQDRHKNVFRWDDKQTLEVIASILGVAVSAQKTDLLIQEAAQLWEELSSQYYSEEGMFHEFARFAQEKLGADIVTYYSLTPTGFPAKPPYYFGKLFVPSRITSPIQDVDSPVIKMIHDWSPLFTDSIQPDSLLGKWGQQHPNSFASREQVQSLCFIPVGTAKERLGAMFLSYRVARRFDGLFRFLVLSFSQTFAILASRGRFKDVVYEGFGRPELGVHNLLGRYGFKSGVLEEGHKIFLRSCLAQTHTDFQQCGMSELLYRMDEFLQAVSLANSSIPPMFWHETLRDELEKFASTLPVGKTNRRPITRINIDAKIERESSWVKLALYRLITEAMNNAVFHGEASAIIIQAQREDNNINVRVVNDGVPLPLDSEHRQSRRGIFSLLVDFEKNFNARVMIERGPDNAGTIVEVNMPAIPLTFEVSHATNYSTS